MRRANSATLRRKGKKDLITNYANDANRSYRDESSARNEPGDLCEDAATFRTPRTHRVCSSTRTAELTGAADGVAALGVIRNNSR